MDSDDTVGHQHIAMIPNDIGPLLGSDAHPLMVGSKLMPGPPYGTEIILSREWQPEPGISWTHPRYSCSGVRRLRFAPAAQQPAWPDAAQVRGVREQLSALPSLVQAADVYYLRSLLARVALGEALVLQAGDCAENPAESCRCHTARKLSLLGLLADTITSTTGKPVIQVGRIAGQYCKPRSHGTERVNNLELPVYRGHMVNRPEPAAECRRPDPANILVCYTAAHSIMHELGWLRASKQPVPDDRPWTSHEALLLDYEIPLLRADRTGRLILTSAHWPWIGERTRQVGGAHVALFESVANPVACKIGPRAAPDELLALCERLDPDREPGRLSLIARMGAHAIADRLPPLVAAVRAAGHPVIWLSDPMHGNTVITPSGRKTRCLDSVVREIEGFQHAVAAGCGLAGGLHLETTPDDVAECIPDPEAVGRVVRKYTTLCDPRLNPEQAVFACSAWK
jgi:3-deoxy-7-phosphoheptulonate synthase